MCACDVVAVLDTRHFVELQEIGFNKLSVRMVSGEVDELWFHIRHGVILPGKNTFRVTCEVIPCYQSHDVL